MRNKLMKRMLVGIGLSCCLAAAWFVPRLAYRHWEARTAPRVISVESPRYEFGVVEPGEMISHRYRMTNSTSRQVKILKVLSSCACTVAELPKRLLAPGESVDIPVSLDTTGRYGSLIKDVTVVTDDPAQGVVRLTLAGEVRMLFSPPSKTVGLTFVRDRETTEEFPITVAGKARHTSLRLRQEGVPEYLQMSIKRMSDTAFLVRETLKPEKAPDRFNAKVFLDPSDTRLPSYPIFIEGQVQSRYTWLPRKLYLGMVKPGETVSRRLTVWTSSGSPDAPGKLSLGSQASASWEVTADVAMPAPNRWDVDFGVRVKPDSRAGDVISGRVVLEDDRHERIEIPLEGFIAEAGQDKGPVLRADAGGGLKGE